MIEQDQELVNLAAKIVRFMRNAGLSPAERSEVLDELEAMIETMKPDYLKLVKSDKPS